MSPITLLAMLVALTLLGIAGQVSGGEDYVCPVCGSHSDDDHHVECPWGSQ